MVVHARSDKISRVLPYSGYYCSFLHFAYETFTLFGMLSQNISAMLESNVCSPNPSRISTSGLGSSAFARHYLQNRLFSFFSSGYLDVSVPRVSLPYTMYSCMDTSTSVASRFPHSDIHECLRIFAPPRVFSQLVTSFFAS